MKRFIFTLSILAVSVAMMAAPKHKPIIGISTNSSNYIYSVRKAGGIPVVIPTVDSEKDAGEVIGVLDGILFTGGEDVNPAYYGEAILNSSVKNNFQRDTSDMLLIAAADKAGIPIMGICRGSQILNVYFGGTLYQDLPTQKPSNINHRQKAPGHIATHKDGVQKGTLIYKLFPVDSVDVNSTHHQAVKNLAPGMKATFISPDGIVEGYESDKVLGIQFHPEMLIKGGNDYFLPLFEEFIKRAGSKK